MWPPEKQIRIIEKFDKIRPNAFIIEIQLIFNDKIN